MKTLFLWMMLFTFPWNKGTQPSEKVLAEGMYTQTGCIYSEKYGEQNSPCTARAFYALIYEDKLIQISHNMETYKEEQVTLNYLGTNNDGYRMYQRNESYQLWVDANYDIVSVLILSDYGGHVKNYYFGQVIKGDHMQEYLQKCQQQMNSTPLFPDEYPTFGW